MGKKQMTPEQYKAYEAFCAVLEYLDGAELQDDMFVEECNADKAGE